MIFFKKLYPLFSFLLLIGFWQLLIELFNYPSFILPTPLEVVNRLIKLSQNGVLAFHILITLQEIIFGLILGFSLGYISGYIFSKFKLVYQLLSPLIITFQAIPVLALAPLLILWFGTGIQSKILVAGLTVYFPVLINTITGFKNINKNYQDLMSSWQANFWQKFKYLEFPSSLPIAFASLKTAVILSIIGAVVGEFVGADKGLGYLINLAGGLYDTPLRFAAFVSLSLIAIACYQLVVFLETKIIKWRY
jgi:NitT/TauT family transport system permease protein